MGYVSFKVLSFDYSKFEKPEILKDDQVVRKTKGMWSVAYRDV